ncbi:MAG: hypothetical protein JWO98_5344 [Frankiales bacterium]|nr:hypothetical protein [Frankiales bacterium]
MTDTTPAPTPEPTPTPLPAAVVATPTTEASNAPVSPWSLAGAKKAYGAGIAGAVTAAGTVSLSGVFADGKLDGGEVALLASTIVGGFVVAFFGAWVAENKPSA